MDDQLGFASDLVTFVRALQAVSTEGRAGTDESSAASPGLQRRDAHDDRLCQRPHRCPGGPSSVGGGFGCATAFGRPRLGTRGHRRQLPPVRRKALWACRLGSACAGILRSTSRLCGHPCSPLSLAPPSSWPSTWMMQPGPQSRAAIHQACAALPYYLHSYPLIVERSWHKLAALGVGRRTAPSRARFRPDRPAIIRAAFYDRQRR